MNGWKVAGRWGYPERSARMLVLNALILVCMTSAVILPVVFNTKAGKIRV